MKRTGSQANEMARVFGRAVRRLREARSWTQTELGDRVHLHQTRISQIENATGSRPTEQNAKDLDRVLGADDLLTDMWPAVYQEIFPDWAQDFLGLSRQAAFIGTYAGGVVPGLLQTEPYARALLRTLVPPDKVEDAVAARLQRQDRLTAEDAPQFQVVLDEAVFLRPVGGREVMRRQLEHLLAMAELPNVTVQVLCCEAGEHALVGGSLTVLRLPDGREFAYSEGADFGRLTEEPGEVKEYMNAYHQVRSMALPVALSLDMIRCFLEDI